MANNLGIWENLEPQALAATIESGGVHYPIYYLSDENGHIAYVDQYTGAVGVIEQEHLQIHNGNAFTCSERITIDDSGGASPVHDILIKVPDGTYPHLRHIKIATTATDVDIDLYENTTVSADGSEKTVNNNSRNSATTPNVTIYNSPTVADVGDILESVLLTGTRQTGSFGTDGANEWILKTNNNSLLRITNNTSGAGSSAFVINIFWYE